jgi:hypothetical protein
VDPHVKCWLLESECAISRSAIWTESNESKRRYRLKRDDEPQQQHESHNFIRVYRKKSIRVVLKDRAATFCRMPGPITFGRPEASHNGLDSIGKGISRFAIRLAIIESRSRRLRFPSLSRQEMMSQISAKDPTRIISGKIISFHKRNNSRRLL